MLELIERVRERLAQGAYANEAAISHGVVTPVLNALGWDSADPHQLVPEYSLPRARVDFALFGLGHRPAVFIEVKGLGRSLDGDRQLFEYAFHQGVPLCVLTDGREWSFYVPGGQGSYDDRRVYRLQLDDRTPEESERILIRYLARSRVRDGSAFEDAQRDYRDAAGRREAVAALPRAWAHLMREPEEVLLEVVGGKAEALCGFRPEGSAVLAFMRSLRMGDPPLTPERRRPSGDASPSQSAAAPASPTNALQAAAEGTASAEQAPPVDRSIHFTMFGVAHECPTAAQAMVEVLGVLAQRDPAQLPELAAKLRGRTRCLIARTTEEINPARPDLARAAEFAPGWLVGLNLSNREKMAIIRTAADLYAIAIPEDLDLMLPNG